MKPEFEALELIKNEEKNRFELKVDGHLAFIEYKEKPGIIILVHTSRPHELEGRQVTKTLVEKTFQYIENNKFQLEPLCPYVYFHIKKHPEWRRILSEEFKEKINPEN